MSCDSGYPAVWCVYTQTECDRCVGEQYPSPAAPEPPFGRPPILRIVLHCKRSFAKPGRARLACATGEACKVHQLFVQHSIVFVSSCFFLFLRCFVLAGQRLVFIQWKGAKIVCFHRWFDCRLFN